VAVAALCTGILSSLLVVLGLVISLFRLSGMAYAKKNEKAADPNYIFHRVQKAHSNLAEWGPMLAVVMLYVDSTSPTVISTLCILVATFGCLVHKIGMMMNVVKPNMTKIVGITLLYVAFSVLSLQVIVIAMGRTRLEKQIY